MTSVQERREMNYPLKFDRCPICHSQKRVIEYEVNAEKAKGKIGKDRIPTTSISMYPVFDPLAGPSLSSPVITVYRDICVCGHEYITLITRQELPRHQIEQLLGMQTIPGKGFKG